MDYNWIVLSDVTCEKCGEKRDCLIVDHKRVCINCGWACEECQQNSVETFGTDLCTGCARTLKY